jgi:hypothetical protein
MKSRTNPKLYRKKKHTVVRMQDYRKPKQAMETRREKRRGRGRPRRIWEDCMVDEARRK